MASKALSAAEIIHKIISENLVHQALWVTLSWDNPDHFNSYIFASFILPKYKHFFFWPTGYKLLSYLLSSYLQHKANKCLLHLESRVQQLLLLQIANCIAPHVVTVLM